AGRSGTWIFLERLVGGEGKLGEDRGKIHVPELRMQQDVSGERARAEAGELGVELERLERHARAGLAVHVGRAVDGRNAERMLDVERKAIGDLIGARFGRAEKRKRLGRD